MCEFIGVLSYEQDQFITTIRFCWKQGKQDVARDFKNFGNNIAAMGNPL